MLTRGYAHQVLALCVVAALAGDVPREIKEKMTVVEALPHAFNTPAHYDESKGPFHFAELRSLEPIVQEKALGSSQQITNVNVKEYKVGFNAPRDHLYTHRQKQRIPVNTHALVTQCAQLCVGFDRSFR